MKCQANPEIAGSPRNAFRCSPGLGRCGGIALERLGGFPLTDPYQTTNAAADGSGRETAGAKIRGREGNNPDRRLRSPTAG